MKCTLCGSESMVVSSPDYGAGAEIQCQGCGDKIVSSSAEAIAMSEASRAKSKAYADAIVEAQSVFADLRAVVKGGAPAAAPRGPRIGIRSLGGGDAFLTEVQAELARLRAIEEAARECVARFDAEFPSVANDRRLSALRAALEVKP
jgi:hypothetical protein